MSEQIRAGVVGFTGYSGAEAVAILRRHPSAQPVLLEHRAQSDAERPAFDDHVELPFLCRGACPRQSSTSSFWPPRTTSRSRLFRCGLAAAYGSSDLSGSYRLRTPDQVHRWYGLDHPDPQLLADAVYGLPELYRDRDPRGPVVSNPGCYPTAAKPGHPATGRGGRSRPRGRRDLRRQVGVSGAGKKPWAKTHFMRR